MKSKDTAMAYVEEVQKLLSANYKNDTLFTFVVPDNMNTLILLDQVLLDSGKKEIRELGSVPTVADIVNTSGIAFSMTEKDAYDYNVTRTFNNAVFDFFDNNKDNYEGVSDYL